MKVCPKCKEEKDLSEFYGQKDRKKGTSYCKKCKNKYDTERWIQRKLDAVQLKGGCCQSCGYDKYYGALHFHHLNPNEKDADWTKLRRRSWHKVVEELDKCVLLCANCHAETHRQN